jgi:hypothetical protein
VALGYTQGIHISSSLSTPNLASRALKTHTHTNTHTHTVPASNARGNHAGRCERTAKETLLHPPSMVSFGTRIEISLFSAFAFTAAPYLIVRAGRLFVQPWLVVSPRPAAPQFVTTASSTASTTAFPPTPATSPSLLRHICAIQTYVVTTTGPKSTAKKNKTGKLPFSPPIYPRQVPTYVWGCSIPDQVIHGNHARCASCNAVHLLGLHATSFPHLFLCVITLTKHMCEKK